jgi:type II secretory pathway component PulF
MASHAGAVLEKSEAGRPGTPLTWGLSLVACAYCLWLGAALFSSTPAFVNMYFSMGVELPLSTRIILGFYYVLYPIVFGGAAILVIAKQYFVREKWANISATLGAVLIADFVANLSVRALYRPLWDLTEKLSK